MEKAPNPPKRNKTGGDEEIRRGTAEQKKIDQKQAKPQEDTAEIQNRNQQAARRRMVADREQQNNGRKKDKIATIQTTAGRYEARLTEDNAND